jgi:hypothetical protein
LVENPPMARHFPTNMHMGAFVSVANVVEFESIPKINLTWDFKILDMYPPMKDLNITI